MDVHVKMTDDWMFNLEPAVKNLLKEGIDVLVYSGDKDFIVNWRGGEEWTHALNWPKKSEFVNSDY